MFQCLITQRPNMKTRSEKIHKSLLDKSDHMIIFLGEKFTYCHNIN